MKSSRNTNNGINLHTGIDHIFSQMQEFLASTNIQSKEDIVKYLNTLIKYADKIVSFYFDNPTKQIDKNFSVLARDEEDGKIISEEGKYHEIIDFLLHEIYDFRDNDFQRQINHKTAFEEKPITADDIYIGHNDTHSGTLQEISTQENFPQVLTEFQQAIKKTKNKLLWMVEKVNRMEQQQMQIKRQKNIEKKQSKAIKDLLSSNDSDITKYAREEDFADGYYSVKNIIKEIYTEKEEYFNNIFLGFDLQNGKFKTSTKKEKQYQKYFLDKGKPIIRLQEVKIDTSKNLPELISQTSLDMIKIMQNNTRSILQTDEQKIDDQINQSWIGLLGEASDKEIIKRIILERYKKYNAKTDQEKHTIIWKVIEIYHNTKMYRKRKLNIDIPLSDDIKIYIANHIRGCYNENHSREKRFVVKEEVLTLPDTRKETVSIKEEEYKQKKKILGEEVFGEGFDFEKVKESKEYTFHYNFYKGLHGRFGDIRRAQIMGFHDMFEGKISCNQIHDFMDKTDLLDDDREKYIQETFKRHYFLQDIERIKTMEKNIQEKFDPSFVMDSEKLCAILHAIIKQVFDNRFLDYDTKGISNMEKEIVAITKRISLYGVIHNHNNAFVIKAYEQGQNDLKDWYQLEIFLDMIKRSGLLIQYNKEHIKQLLQKGHDESQYNINGFEVREINKIEKIKKIAVDLDIKLDLPPHPPLEAYYIHRLRTPERILDKQSKENFFNRHEGTFGYDEGNLASVHQLEGFSQDFGMSLRRKEVLNIDMRAYKNISPESNFDIDTIVPVAVNFPKVRVLMQGNWNEKGSMQGHYVFFYNPEKHLYSMIFDDSFMNAELLMQRYKLTEQVILGGGFLIFNKETSSILIEDRIDRYHHEPRILTITALKNAIKDILPDYKIFIGNDGMDKMTSYF